MEISLTHGKVTVIDDVDWPLVAPYKWRAEKKRNVWYAATKQEVYMHRILVGAERGQVVDHKDRDGLNNRRGNLRLATSSQNQGNAKLWSTNTSGFRGVVRYKGKWKAQIYLRGKYTYLGLYKTKEEAAAAYDKAARQQFGEFAYLNLSQVGEGSQDKGCGRDDSKIRVTSSGRSRPVAGVPPISPQTLSNLEGVY